MQFWTYNANLQLARQRTALPYLGTVVDIGYTYPQGANNGRISQMKDYVSGEEVNYAYDELNRLTSATTTGSEWGLNFGYDGFGNRMSQTVTKGSAPASSLGYNPATNHLEGLPEMTWILISLTCLVCTVAVHAESSSCSLIVKVISPAGHEIDSRIVVREKDGRQYASENEIGGARFCNLGLLPVDIEIGNEGCNQVVIRNAHLTWSTSTIITAIYDVEPCLRDLPRGNACDILFRVFGPDGVTPVPSATIDVLRPYRKQQLADEYGRAFLSVGFGSDLSALVRAPGFAAYQAEVRCTADAVKQDRKVTLKRTDTSR